MTETGARLRWAYQSLLREFGPQGWWPGRSPFEIMVGAILTQNAAWRNAERAIERVRAAGALTPAAVATLPLAGLEQLVRPAGAWRRKARTLAALAETIEGEEGGLQGLLSGDPAPLRETLLAIRGIGPETADAMLLYAGGHPVFVVDAYTRRFVERHGIASGRAPYDSLQKLFTDALGHDADAFAECHALLVELGKRFCRPEPICCECPLRKDLPKT
ncbi:endonuclease III domain-containing protein [bacterium]|nr:endonuclease III domain-containing protein [bacterium]